MTAYDIHVHLKDNGYTVNSRHDPTNIFKDTIFYTKVFVFQGNPYIRLVEFASENEITVSNYSSQGKHILKFVRLDQLSLSNGVLCSTHNFTRVLTD